MKTQQLYLTLAEAIRNATETPPCQETDPDAFYVEQGDWATLRRAKALCASCPVIAECAAYAINANEPFGVWGGTTARERGRIRGTANLAFESLET